MDQRTLETVHRLFPAATEFNSRTIADLFDMADLVESIQRRICDLAEETGMPSLHFFVLEHLALHGGVTLLEEILNALNIPKQSATYIIDSLERDGLVQRRKDKVDRRRLQVALTQKGRRRVKANIGPFYSTMLGALQTISEKDRTKLLRSLGRIRDALNVSAASE